jgi:RNA polymerase sigma factor (sigma-70 family)
VANTPRTDALATEEAERLQMAMDQLREEHREVIRLRNWQDLSFVQIGEQMARSPDAARKLWTRAVMNLQGFLKKD